MLHYWLRLWPQQPLILDDPRRIPARTLRGALSAIARRGCVPNARHLNGSCGKTCLYWPLFGNEAPGATIRIGEAIATMTDDILPLPISARTCRHHPGFSGDDQAGKPGHGVRDTAIRAWVFEQAVAQPDQILAPFEACCPQCGADSIPWQNGARYVHRESDTRWTLADPPIRPVVTTHRSAAEVVFSQAATMLADKAYYVARIDLPESFDAVFHDLIQNGLMVGARRTRGAGFARCGLIPRQTPPEAVQTRIQLFNRAVRAEQRFYALMQGRGSQTGALAADQEEGAWLFTLDAVNVQLPIGQLSPLSGIPGLATVQILRRWTQPATQDGYRTASAQRAGSRPTVSGTWLCRVPPTANRESIEQTFVYLEAHGVGVDAARGGGDATICHPFHLVVTPC